jgi:hypothetical protein
MHFHLPKPLHGWREFAGEVGIIVIGVLIALGAEQVVEDWHWQQKVAVVRKSLIGELANDRARWEVDLANATCSVPDVDRLEQWAKQGGTVPAPPVPTLTSDNWWFMHSANWNLATGSQTLDHFPVDQQLAFAALYDGIAHRQGEIENGTNAVERIQALMALGGNPEAMVQLRIQLGGLRQSIHDLRFNAAYMTRHFDALGVKPDRSDFAPDLVRGGCVS